MAIAQKTVGVLDDNGYVISATAACILSEEDNAGPGAGSVVDADNLTIQSPGIAEIGLNSNVNVTDTLTITSMGSFSSSTAIIKAGSEVNAGSIRIEAIRRARIGENNDVTADSILIDSTGDLSASDAGIKSGPSVITNELSISASREAKIGQNTMVVVAGNVLVESTGPATGSLVIVRSGADVTVRWCHGPG